MSKKSDDKKGFVLYNDYNKHIEILSDEDAGKLFKNILAYVNDKELTELPEAAGMAFSFIKAQLERDKLSYEKKCKANRANGSLGGRPKTNPEGEGEKEKPNKTQQNPDKPNGFVGYSGNEPEPEEKAKKSRKKDYPEGFNEFWKVYPRATDKGKAYEKYAARVKDGYSPEELLAAARAYRAHCEANHTNPEYILHGKTFLGPNGRFLEYLPKGQDPGGQSDGYEMINFSDYV